MKLGRRASGALLVLAVAVAPACSRKPRAHASHVEATAPAAPVPTPDNTPIDILRTPAGMVLKVEEPDATPRGPVTTPAPTAPPGARTS